MATKIRFRNKFNKRHIITVNILTERSLYQFLNESEEWEIVPPHISIKHRKKLLKSLSMNYTNDKPSKEDFKKSVKKVSELARQLV